jgi:hypothetical protein
MFTVTFLSLTMNTAELHTFSSKRGALKFAAFLSSKSWASGVTVWNGQPGGMRVEA